MSHDPHLGFIIAAYALAFAIVAGMVVTILADYRNLKQALASLAAAEEHRAPEARGSSRLDDGTPESQDREGVA